MADKSWAAVKSAANKRAIISCTPENGQNTPSTVNETDINNLNNSEKMVQYIKKLQVTVEQYKTWENASFIAPRIRKKASIEIPRTWMEAIQMQSKGKAKLED